MSTPMRWLTLACVAAILWLGPSQSARGQATAPENPVPEGFVLSPMARATVFVRDQQESLKLYRDILGLRVRFDQEFSDERFNQVLGTEGRTFRMTILQSGDTIYGNVGLLQFVDDDHASSQPLQTPAARTGDVALVFMTSDIDTIAGKLRAAGYTIISPPMVLFPREDMTTDPREMLFRDRDGILVNLIQPGVPREQ
ncbi:MAG: VOC family protein [Gammaproteobacteria bacterium]|nr:VOC family protein [Gammaproteobacteria bacterium]